MKYKMFCGARYSIWPVIINETIVQQNRIKSLHQNGNTLEQKRRCSNIPGRLHQSPAAQLAQELNSIAVDYYQYDDDDDDDSATD